MADDKFLHQARADIDALDDQLLELLSRRGLLAQQVARRKRDYADGKVIYYRPEREVEVLLRVGDANAGPFPDQSIRAIYHEVISATLALEHRLRIAVSAAPGSASALAALMHFGRSAQVIKFASDVDVLRAVDQEVDLALVAVGDAEFGLFPEQLEKIFNSGLSPLAEVVVDGQYGVFVVGSPAAGLPVNVDRSMAIAPELQLPVESLNREQYRRLLGEAGGNQRILANMDRELPGWLMDGRFATFIVPVETRFLVLGSQTCQATGSDRTLLAVELDREPSEVLPAGFDQDWVSWVEMVPGRWAMIIDGHRDDKAVQELIGRLTRDGGQVSVAGSWSVVGPTLPTPLSR